MKIVHANDRGLLLGVAEDVTVTYTGDGIDTTGVLMVPGGSFRSGTVSTLGTAVTGGGSGTSTVRDSVLYGRTGVSTGTSASTLNASRLTVRASHRGASTEGHLSLVNSVIVLQADAEYGLMAGSNADVPRST